jgi:septum formation protein
MSILHRPLVLASTSEYRREILAKLRLPFTQISPDFAEIAMPQETPAAMARRFAAGKAMAVASLAAGPGVQPLVIGSDQVVTVNGEHLQKPGTVDRAEAQLSRCSGQWVTYCSAVSLATKGHTLTLDHELYHVKFRHLTAAEIRRYVALDEPLNCAGSIKAESLGVTLFSSTRGEDINTLYGLPLLRLAKRLREQGIDSLHTL